MFYVKRDALGKIILLSKEPIEASNETLVVTHPEVLLFLKQNKDVNEIKELLAYSDLELARILEDLISLLVEKELILFTELPQAAQNKLLARQSHRSKLQAEVSILSDQNDTI